MGTDACAAGQQGEDSGKVLHFPQGIPGFESYTKYTLFHKEENDVSAYWLESVESPKITFTLVDPTTYGLHYTLELTDTEQQLLGATDPNQLAVLMMLSKPEAADGQARPGLSANISGPLVINLQNRRGMQKVLMRSRVNVNIIET